VEATAGQQAAEFLVPAEHLSAQAHHQQQGRAIGVAEGLVLDLDPVRVQA
jgi:PDZ domain-containing secreted protein